MIRSLILLFFECLSKENAETEIKHRIVEYIQCHSTDRCFTFVFKYFGAIRQWIDYTTDLRVVRTVFCGRLAFIDNN